MATRFSWVVGLVLVVAPSGARAFDDEQTLTRVRGTGEEFRELIREGDKRSRTFRSMVDEIQRSNAIVMVQFGLCANGQVRSCVSHVGGNASTRTIRILINTRTTNDRLIATIAHELHHALEIIREPGITDREQVMELYRRIGIGKCGEGRSSRCETEAALDVERKVLAELEG